MARKRSEHVYGPERHRNRWRILFVDGDGRRSRESFASEGEARAAAEAFRARIQGRKVSDAIAEYMQDRAADGLRPISLVTIEARLRTMFECNGDRTGGLLAEVTPSRARVLLDALAVRHVTAAAHGRRPARQYDKPRSVDYRLGALAYTRTFVAWCIKRGYLRRDPFEGLTVKGKRKKGKPQLHGSEAQRFVDTALEAAREPGRRGDAAFAAVLALMLGARPSEIADRQCRDVDLAGAVLWIPESKTDAGRRRSGVPEFLRHELQARADRGAADAPLFPGLDRWRLLKRVYQLCDEAGVRRVCTHSLRGLHGSLATEAGATAEMVARQLGHAGTAVTHGHYIAPAAAATARAGRVLGVIRGGRS